MSRPIRSNRPLHAGRLVLLTMPLALLLPISWLSAQCTLICNQNLSISLDNAGQAAIPISLIVPGGGSSCTEPLDLQLRTAQGLLLANPLTCASIGKTITATVRHPATGNSCSGTLKVQDALPPVLDCAEKTVFCGQDDSPLIVGLPTMTDNCTAAAALIHGHYDLETNLGCNTTHAGYPVIRRIDRHWTVTDGSGNSSTCIQQIWVRRPTAADVVFPANLNGFELPALDCSESPQDLDLTGQPSIGGKPIENGSLCEIGIGHEDQIINHCLPAGYTVLRTWSLIEFCNSAVTQRQQIIQVKDKTLPVILSPANFTVGTSGDQCSATVYLPTTSATDNCSTVTIAAAWAYGSGLGPFTNVPLGSHVVTYTATDACGNMASTTTLVTVVDNSPPTVLCTSALQLSLGSDGTSNLYATALNAGSYDQCGDVTMDITRDDVTYATSLVVTCADLDHPVPVTLRVRDAVGLDNFCVTNVTVRDFLKPVLLCPPNVTLTCQQDYHDVYFTGAAQAADNCAVQSLDSTNVVALNGCYIGLVTRSWKATDASGNTRICTQTITMTPVSAITVVFPADAVVNSCGSATATAPSATGQPIVSGQSCFPLSVTYTDQVFSSAPPSCYRIVRTWKVIDFCVYNPNGGSAGYWQRVQVVDVRDNVAPILYLPADITVSSGLSSCLAQLSMTDATALDCSSTVLITHNSAYAAPGRNASGTYPAGIHNVIFQATDGCGNVAQQTMRITVRDVTPPAAVCATGLAVSLGPAGVIALTGETLDGGSSDQCSPVASLHFSTSPAAFTCAQSGYQPVVLTVTDAAGNSATCQTLVNVQDSAGACGETIHKVDGNIRTPTGQQVAEISLRLLGDGFAEVADCDSLGHFTFSDVPTGSYLLKPENNAKWLNGVTTFDLLLISRHILGLQPLNSPYKMLAADANRSGSITAFDIVQLRKVILGISDTLPTGTSWRFMPADFVFTDTLNPFVNLPPEVIAMNNLQTDLSDRNFIGIKTGDLNGNTNSADPRSPQDTAWVELPDLVLQPGLPVIVPLRLESWAALSGFQFELAFQPDLVTLDSVDISLSRWLDNTHIARRNGHSLAISWDDDRPQPESADSVLLVLHLRPKQACSLRSVVRLQRERLVPESYPVDRESIAPLDLRFTPKQDSANGPTAAMQVFPNPFSDQTTLSFDLPEAGQVQLLVSDVTGLPIFSRQRDFAAGHQQWRIPGSELPGPGVYYCRLVSAKRTFSAVTGLIFGP